MNHRISKLIPTLGATVFLAGCDQGPSKSAVTNSSSSPPPAVAATSSTPTDIGPPLFNPVTPAPRPAVVGLTNAPIVVRQCQITLAETQNAPSKNDGKLLFYCTEIQPGETVDPQDIVVHPRTKKQYRKIKEGTEVKKGQLLAILDDEQAAANRDIQNAALVANEAKKLAAIKLKEFALLEEQMYLSLRKSGGTESEYRRAVAQRDKAEADVAEAEGQIKKSIEDLKKANIILGEHEIRSDIDGYIKRFYRKPGEAVKALEPVLEIQNLAKLRVEGLMDVQYLPGLLRGKNQKVFIETAVQDGPLGTLDGHLQPVRAVAVSKDPAKSLVVTASEDKTARVWDRGSMTEKISWPHKAPVRAVACTGPKSDANLALTGADDGIGRIWDLGNLGPNPLRELKVRHAQPISCVAFAPDGKTCASADAKEILLWDVATGDLRYRFPSQHKGPVTYIQYTPQAKLVSVARDRSLVVWNLGEKGASVDTVIEHRSGDVPVLGATSDGSRVLFDLERTLRVLTLPEQRTEEVFLSPTDSGHFSTFAIFSPDSRLVLAAGTGENGLQLWKAPSPGVRGHLFRRLFVGQNVLPTCAAFSPDGSFAVTGSTDNRVLVWGMPPKAEIEKVVTGQIVFRDQSIDPNDRRVRIWAELTNPEGTRLLPGDTVTLVIPQEGR